LRNRIYTKGRKQLCRDEVVTIPRTCRERFLSLESPHLLPLHEAGIRFAGMSVLGQGYHIIRRDPRWHSLVYSFEGSGVLKTEGREQPLHPGSLYIAPAHCAHEYWIKEGPWKLGWFCMEEHNAFHCAPVAPLVVPSSSAGLVSSVLEQLTDDPGSAAHSHPEILRDCVKLMITILRHDAEAALASRQQQHERRLDAAFLAVHRDPSFNWTVPSLIRQGHLPFGEDRLRQLCTEFYGHSPMQHVRSIRMQIAKELLTATDYPLRTIAPMVGYGNEFAFSTAFSRETGLSPQAFRDRL